MKIAIVGATGFLGGALSEHLKIQGHSIESLSRNMFDDQHRDELIAILEKCDIVINLAGKSLLGRWTKRHKKEVYSSRVELTNIIVEAINATQTPPKLFISASATGYYPSNKIYSERNDENGNDYLSWLCNKWETAASQVKPQVRLAIIRISPVLSKRGGILKPLFRSLWFKVSLKLGRRGNCFSWIHLDDFIAAIDFVILNQNISGVINLSAPGVTTNDYMAMTLSEIMHAHVIMRVPSSILSLAFGEAQSMICASKAIYPAVLLEKGFKFRFPYIRAALENIART